MGEVLLDELIGKLERDSSQWFSDAQLPLVIVHVELLMVSVQHSQDNLKSVRRVLSGLVNVTTIDKPSQCCAALTVSNPF